MRAPRGKSDQMTVPEHSSWMAIVPPPASDAAALVMPGCAGDASSKKLGGTLPFKPAYDEKPLAPCSLQEEALFLVCGLPLSTPNTDVLLPALLS